MTDLSELLERVKSATGPDRELDGLLELVARSDGRGEHLGHGIIKDAGGTYAALKRTASVDAALAFSDRVLPGWGVYFRRDKDTCGAGMVFPEYPKVTPGHGEGASIPLAIIAATLTALISQEPVHDHQ